MHTKTKVASTSQKHRDNVLQKKNTSALLPAVPVQFKTKSKEEDEKVQLKKKENNTGLPNNLKAGIENLSGFSMDDVKVHYNSDKPAQLNAHAYAQGTDIHIGPSQEKHLPHEAWHVVQQKQGRVKATMQMKGVAVNDDKGLEGEADIMGEKAQQLVQLSQKNNLNNLYVSEFNSGGIPKSLMNTNEPLQMKVNSNSFRELLVEQKKISEDIENTSMGKGVPVNPEPSVTPKFDAEKLFAVAKEKEIPVVNIQQLNYHVNRYNNEHLHLSTEQDFTPQLHWEGFLEWLTQKSSKKHVTVGFEFEFSTMGAGNPFEGVPHVELSASTQKINGESFLLETDASNALELVTPPLWLEAVNNETPLPTTEDVRKIDELIKARLKEMVKNKLTMAQLSADFQTDPGLTFNIAETKVKAKNLSDRSIGKFTKDHDAVSAENINQIEVGEITKYGHGGIDTQVNIATDAASYMALARLNIQSRKDNRYVKQFYDLQDHLENSIQLKRFDMPLSGFLQLVIRNIAGQLALPSMKYIQTMQNEAFATGKFNKGKSDLDFEFYAWASSGVKDIGNVWIKDNIINIGIGILEPDDWKIVFEVATGDLFKQAILNFKIPEYLTNVVSDKLDDKIVDKVVEENFRKVSAYYNEAKKYMSAALSTLATKIKELNLATIKSGAVIATPKSKFMGHNPEFINPRQDTHVPPDKVDIPAWKRRLHVTELRSEPADTLEKWITKIAGDKTAKEQREQAKQQWEQKAKPYELCNKFLEDLNLSKQQVKELTIAPKFADVYNLTLAEYEAFKRRTGMLKKGDLDACISRAKDLAFDSNKHPVQEIATNEEFQKFD